MYVSEVAHDYQVQVSHYVTKEFGLLNSYDTWHGVFIKNERTCTKSIEFMYPYTCTNESGTKNVAKELKKIA